MAPVVAGEDRTKARRLQRLAAADQLRRIYAGIYTDDLPQPLQSIVRRGLFALCPLGAPGSIIRIELLWRADEQQCNLTRGMQNQLFAEMMLPH
jgi:hypothetical protein